MHLRITRRPRSRARFWLLAAGVPVAAALALGGWAASAYSEREPAEEALSLQHLIGTRGSAVVADIGAGDGRIAAELGRLLGSGSTVYATELDKALLGAIAERARSSGAGNVTAVAAGERSTNLPAECCDAIFMRRVYHDLTEPREVLRDVRRALKPGGRLAIVDFEPTFLGDLLMPRRANRPGHGIERDDLVREVTASGFRLERGPETWPDHNMFAAVFTR